MQDFFLQKQLRSAYISLYSELLKLFCFVEMDKVVTWSDVFTFIVFIKYDHCHSNYRCKVSTLTVYLDSELQVVNFRLLEQIHAGSL